MEEPTKAPYGVSALGVMGNTIRAARLGLPYGRIPQSNRSMDKETFAALGRVLGFMCENLRDVIIPESIDEDGVKLKRWIDNYKQHIT